MSGPLVPGGKVESPRWRSLWWIVVGLFVAVVVAALAAMLALVNGEAAKAAIEQQLVTCIGTDFRFKELEFHVWRCSGAELH